MPETPIAPMISPLRMIGMSECLADGFDRHLALADRQAIVEGGDYVLDAFDDFELHLKTGADEFLPAHVIEAEMVRDQRKPF